MVKYAGLLSYFHLNSTQQRIRDAGV